jgi:hypothetical protein
MLEYHADVAYWAQAQPRSSSQPQCHQRKYLCIGDFEAGRHAQRGGLAATAWAEQGAISPSYTSEIS